MQATGTTGTAAGPKTRTDGSPSNAMEARGRAWQAIGAFADWYADHCRRIRAYMDLTRLDHMTLHTALSDPDEHDRILDGRPPRRKRHRS
jgi:hypothetical protein